MTANLAIQAIVGLIARRVKSWEASKQPTEVAMAALLELQVLLTFCEGVLALDEALNNLGARPVVADALTGAVEAPGPPPVET